MHCRKVKAAPGPATPRRPALGTATAAPRPRPRPLHPPRGAAPPAPRSPHRAAPSAARRPWRAAAAARRRPPPARMPPVTSRMPTVKKNCRGPAKSCRAASSAVIFGQEQLQLHLAGDATCVRGPSEDVALTCCSRASASDAARCAAAAAARSLPTSAACSAASCARSLVACRRAVPQCGVSLNAHHSLGKQLGKHGEMGGWASELMSALRSPTAAPGPLYMPAMATCLWRC